MAGKDFLILVYMYIHVSSSCGAKRAIDTDWVFLVSLTVHVLFRGSLQIFFLLDFNKYMYIFQNFKNTMDVHKTMTGSFKLLEMMFTNLKPFYS